MEDQGQEHGMERNSEPVRSRWTPKPEQIVILESIFNSGMVNPPKDETVRIRKLLEPYGSVGDANVFYWFQNRRSRSRRRQRQIQASLAVDRAAQAHTAGAIQYQSNLMPPSAFVPSSSSAASCLLGSSSSSPSSCGGGSGLTEDTVDHLFSFSPQMGTTSLQDMEHISSVTSTLCPSNTSNLHYQSGYVTVFINGVPTEVPKGSFDMKGMFGQEFMLVHSSGVPVPFNEFGFSVQSLQHGESYFLVSRHL